MNVRSAILISIILVIAVLGSAALVTGDEHVDEELDDGEFYWSGQSIGAEEGIDDDSTYRLYQDDNFIQELSTDDGWLNIDTENYGEGEFDVLRTDGEHIASYQVMEQGLNVTADPEQSIEGSGEDVTFSFKSDRATFDIQVSSSGLSASELEELLTVEDERVENTEDAIIVADVEPGEEIVSDTDSLQYGTYEISWDVTDSTASDTTTIEYYSSPRGSASFITSVHTENRGDVATSTLALDGVETVDIQIGEDFYQHNVTLRDANNNGMVSFEFDLYEAGAGNQPVSAGDGTELEAAEDDVDMPEERLAAGTYEMIARVDGTERDRAFLDVLPIEVDGTTTMVLPEHKDVNRETVMDDAIETTTVAEQDTPIIRVDTTSVYSAFSERVAPENLDPDSSFVDNHGFSLTISDDESREADLRESRELYVEPSEKAFYLVLDTHSLPGMDSESDEAREIESLNEFSAEFVFTMTSPLIEDEDGEVTVSNELDIQEDAVIPTHDEEDYDVSDMNPFTIQNSSNETLTAETSLSPGTDITLHTHGLNSSISEPRTATVNESGALKYDFNLSDVEADTEFTVEFEETDDIHMFVVKEYDSDEEDSEEDSEEEDAPELPLVESINIDQESTVGDGVLMRANLSDDVAANEVTISWDVDDRTRYGVATAHAFSSPREYNITVTASHRETDISHQLNETVEVSYQYPEPEVNISSSPARVFTGDQFTIEATVDNVPDDVINYTWNVGDNEVLSGSSVTHMYESPGEYEVVVEAKTNEGKSDKESTTVTTTEMHPLVRLMHELGPF